MASCEGATCVQWEWAALCQDHAGGRVTATRLDSKAQKTGAYARGELYEKQPDRSYKLLADVALQNPVAPVDVLLSNCGYLLTFDNWHNAGYGKVVAIYRPTGELVRSYELEALYLSKQLEAIPTYVSSRWWRCRPFDFVDPDVHTQVYVAEHFGVTFTFDLSTGTHAVPTRAVEVPDAVSRSIDWPVDASSTRLTVAHRVS